MFAALFALRLPPSAGGASTLTLGDKNKPSTPMDIAFAISVAFNLLVLALFIFFKKGVEAFIDFRKSKALAEFQKELDERYEKRRKMELVADLFSRHFNKRDEVYEFEKLNWELALFLPKELVCEISEKLVNATEKHEVMELFIKIRESLGVKDGLEPDHISYLVHRTEY